VTVECGDCGLTFPASDPCGHGSALNVGAREGDSMVKLTTEIRDVVEGLHGRPKNKRGVQVVIAEVICKGGEPCWIAKVKVGGAIVAKCCASGHVLPTDALDALLASTKQALGVTS
jgi:hypothetical protein